MSESDLTSAQAEEVRRLLAQARHTDPIPGDVAARLDETVASLSRERVAASPAPAASSPATDSPASAGVVDLGARRRRRLTTGLLAAAAVTVIGFSVPTLLPSGSDSGSDSSEASETSSLEESGSDSLGTLENEQAPTDDDAGSSSGTGPESGAGPEAAISPESQADEGDDSAPLTAADARVVRPDTFDQDVARIIAAEPRALRRTAPPVPLKDWCPVRIAWGEGATLPVRYVVDTEDTEDADRAVLVVRASAGGASSADLFVCGEDDVTRSTTVPAG